MSNNVNWNAPTRSESEYVESSTSEKFRLHQQLGEEDGLDGSGFEWLEGYSQDDSLEEPEVLNAYGTYGDFRLVGHGEVTNDYCGKFYGLKGCLRADLHDIVTLDGTNYRGKVFIRVVHRSCNKPSCPICFKSGWAVRQAERIETRLKEAARLFGQIEHIVASVPAKEYHLSFEVLRKKAKEILDARGIMGGTMIFHGFRFSPARQWYWSPHFHVIGFVEGGYESCRGCTNERKSCLSCKGFEGRTRRLFKSDGYIVKVLGKRLTVFGTAWYMLNHSSIKVGVKRFHVASWFGCCSYRKMKVSPEKSCRRDVCPICHEELKKVCHLGVRRIVKVKGEHGYAGSFLDDAVGCDGSPNYCEEPSVNRRSGSSEDGDLFGYADSFAD